jgi:hypothetical protein
LALARIFYLFCVGLCFQLLCSPVFAQRAKIDSLVRMAVLASDTTKVKLLTELCWAYRNSQIDSAIIYGNLAVEQAKKTNFVPYFPKLFTYLGVLHRNKGNYTKALTYFFDAVMPSR